MQAGYTVDPGKRADQQRRTRKGHDGNELLKQARSLSGPPDHTNASPGRDSLPKLNPRFVEWLMGLPFGWTDFEPSGTEWSRWRQRMQSALSRLGR